MIIISNKEIPEQAKRRLENYGDVLYFESDEITYPEISGHPDIFFCQIADSLIIAPNTPEQIKKLLKSYGIRVIEGDREIGYRYPETAIYNAVVTDDFYIHNLDVSDSKMKELCADRRIIHVNQAYTRCNLLPLNNNRFITSDKGIQKVLGKNSIDVLYADPSEIILPGFKNGFFGGACGVSKNNSYILGQLNYLSNGKEIADYITSTESKIIELYNGQLYDAGSLIFIDNPE